MDKVRLGDVASLITKGTTPTTLGYDFVDNGINFIKIESISDDGNFIKDKFAYIDEKCNSKLNRSQLCENDILFSIAGAIGRVAIVDKSILPANTNQALAIIRVPKGIFEYDFLKYVLKSSIISKQYDKQKQGVAQINLSLKNICDFEIPLLSLEQQKEIVDVLDKLTDLIDKRKKQLEKLDELIKSRFVEMFGDPVTNPFGWTQTTLNKVSIGKLSYGSGASACEFDGDTRYIRITDIDENGKLNNNIVSPNAIDKKYILNDGDILFARTGATVGKSYRYSLSDGKCLYAGYLIRLIPNKEFVLPDYVFYYTKTDYYKRFIEASMKVVAQPNINAQQYGNLVICVPPMELQKEFLTFITQVNNLKSEIQNGLEKLELLKNALMQKYFG